MKKSNATGTFNAKIQENGGTEISLDFTTLYLDFATGTLSVAGFVPGSTQPEQGLQCDLSGAINPGVFPIGAGASAFYNTGKPGDSSWNAVSGKITLSAVDIKKSASGEIEFTAQDAANPTKNAFIRAKFSLTNI
ncbi:hypothetical protein [Pseudomonas sp. MWU12-2029]|jgi:hypothetical protein|uniref:hypothetical protein n=1 Tax=Pseudomonas sp. MWU12-2029 TaxID=2927805 RepID=UPI00200F4985|nr:hypothetical protein [Pseudomonas sp. MWU12-2029]